MGISRGPQIALETAQSPGRFFRTRRCEGLPPPPSPPRLLVGLRRHLDPRKPFLGFDLPPPPRLASLPSTAREEEGASCKCQIESNRDDEAAQRGSNRETTNMNDLWNREAGRKIEGRAPRLGREATTVQTQQLERFLPVSRGASWGRVGPPGGLLGDPLGLVGASVGGFSGASQGLLSPLGGDLEAPAARRKLKGEKANTIAFLRFLKGWGFLGAPRRPLFVRRGALALQRAPA